MPHATNSGFQYITVSKLAPTFGAEISGLDFTKPIPPEVFDEVHRAITEYSVLYVPTKTNPGLDDARHVAFARLFGELDDWKPYLSLGRKARFPFIELFDVSNQEDDGSLVVPGSKRDHMGKGNGLFHVDSAFNARRAGFSLLRAHELPPRGMGGNTDFADTRTAFADLPSDLKTQLLANDYIGANSNWHSRKKAVPDSIWLKDINVLDYPFGRHRIVQKHEGSGKMNLYIANHLHHLEYPDGRWVEEPESTNLIEELLAFATQDKYRLSIEWRDECDLIIWDNTAVMHRAGPGTFAGKFKRDMRRCTVHDGSSTAWGLNPRDQPRSGLP